MRSSYLDEVKAILTRVEQTEQPVMNEASSLIADAIQSHHLIHLFGCGHSHLLTEELFYRSGGLAAIRPILIEELMLHKGAARSSQLERQNDFAHTFMQDQDIRKGDICIVISTSGVNPVPIDVALLAKEKGAFVIGLTSPSYATSRPSRHKDGFYLHEVVDLVLNNHVPKGDALLHEQNIAFGSGSTVVGATILNQIVSQAISQIIQSGSTPPVFLSGNIEGADEHNQKLIAAYKDRIPML
ncbi:SIS domain-containing protein [Priestia megaterium]|nr:SIS domain-containing protein [Priestia megaterium]